MNDAFTPLSVVVPSIATAVSRAGEPPPQLKVIRERAKRAARDAERDAERKRQREERERLRAERERLRAERKRPREERERQQRLRPKPQPGGDGPLLPPPPPPLTDPPPHAATAHAAAVAATPQHYSMLQQDASPPGSVRLLRKQLRGLKAAQGVERTAQREQQIGELEYELEERERKYKKYGSW